MSAVEVVAVAGGYSVRRDGDQIAWAVRRSTADEIAQQEDPCACSHPKWMHHGGLGCFAMTDDADSEAYADDCQRFRPACPDCGTPSDEHWNRCSYYLRRQK